MSDRFSASYNQRQTEAGVRMNTNHTGYKRLGEYFRGTSNKMAKKTGMIIGAVVVAVILLLLILWWMKHSKTSSTVYYF